MRVSNKEKEISRERILVAAGRLFRQNGVLGTSVGDIMGEAGMTHGGFYRHFSGKEDLLKAALTDAFETFSEPLRNAPEGGEEAAAESFRARYLSADHLASPGAGCPAAALGPDIARADDAVRETFSGGVNLIVDGLARGLPSSAAPRTDALRDLAMMVGAIVLARGTDTALAAEILEACAAPAIRTRTPGPTGIG